VCGVSPGPPQADRNAPVGRCEGDPVTPGTAQLVEHATPPRPLLQYGVAIRQYGVAPKAAATVTALHSAGLFCGGGFWCDTVLPYCDELARFVEEGRGEGRGGRVHTVHAEAQLTLGQVYAGEYASEYNEAGTDITPDPIEAEKWYRKAAAQGDSQAQEALDNL